MEKLYIDKDELRNYLTTHNKKSAAKHFGVSLHTITRRLSEYGINATQCRLSTRPDRLNEQQLNILTGCLLGDGCIPNVRRKNQYFKFGQAIIKKEYVEFVHNVFKDFSYDIKFSTTNNCYKCYFYTVALPLFTDLRKKWYSDENGGICRKVIPNDINLNWVALSFWFADDGSNYQPNKNIFLYTNCFTIEEVLFLIERLKSLGIRSVLYKSYDKNYDKHYPIIRISQHSYFDFIDGVSNYLKGIDCLSYKIDINRVGQRPNLNYKSRVLGKENQQQAKDLYSNMVYEVSEIASKFDVSVATIERCIYSCKETREKRKQSVIDRNDFIVKIYADGMKQKDIANRFGISQAAVSLIISQTRV